MELTKKISKCMTHQLKYKLCDSLRPVLLEFILKVLIQILFLFAASADVGFAIYDRYASEQIGPPVSYVAHLTGALAGLTIGLLVLKNFEQKLHEQLMWWVALGVYAACTIFAVLFNVSNPDPWYHEGPPGLVLLPPWWLQHCALADAGPPPLLHHQEPWHPLRTL